MMIHKSVLLQESIDGLDLHAGELFVDGTLGSGGHSLEVVKRFGTQIHIIGIDGDSDAISRSRDRLEAYKPNIQYVEGNFRNIEKILDDLGISEVNKILFDIGMSSDQFESGRGFSFQKDEPLNMAFSKTPDMTAADIVNNWDEENIATILSAYGNERFSKKIARAIVETRPINTTNQLVQVILKATPEWYHHRKIHPATRTFQALRIVVNDEIQSLKQGIVNGFEKLKQNGRLAVITFHSVEDRTVKQFFKEKEDEGSGIRINKKPIVPGETEIEINPRSRSAKLRIIQKL